MFHQEDNRWPEQPPVPWWAYALVILFLIGGAIGILLGVIEFIHFINK